MKSSIASLAVLLVVLTGCGPCLYGRCVRPARDITPGNCPFTTMDWRYGAPEIEIQTGKVTRDLMDRWYARTGYDYRGRGVPRIVITEIDNCTDQYVSTDMIRDIIEGCAINDGRFTITVGNTQDRRELDQLLKRITLDPKYANSSRLIPGQATAPQFLGKIRLTKAITTDRCYAYEDYRMTITLYDIETQEAIDSSWDLLRKQVLRR